MQLTMPSLRRSRTRQLEADRDLALFDIAAMIARECRREGKRVPAGIAAYLAASTADEDVPGTVTGTLSRGLSRDKSRDSRVTRHGTQSRDKAPALYLVT